MQASKFQVVFIGIFAVFIVIGVIIFAMGGKKSGSENNKVVVWGTIPQSTFAKVFSNSSLFNSKTIAVSYVEKSESNFDTDFLEALAGGGGPDVIFIASDKLLKNKNKIFTIPFSSLSERTFKDTYAEEGELFLVPDGILGLPITIDPIVMYWNRDIFSNAGLSAPPSFWDEFFNLSQNLTTKDGAFNITRSAIALGEYRNITNAKDILSALFLQAGNPIVSLANGVPVSVLREKLGLAVPPGVAALSFFTEFSNSAKAYYSWNRSLPPSQTVFLSGDLAIYFGLGSEFPLLKLKNPNLNFDVSRFPQSSNVRTGTRKVTFGRMEGVSIVRNSKNIGGAFTVVSELAGKNLGGAFSQELFRAPARRDLLSVKQTDSILPILYDSALWSKGWLDPDKKMTESIFEDMIESVTGGRARLESAINQASIEIGALLNK
jgi:ABC-type glycerol-3-phosphate transport system substrate-binding protein